MTRALLHQHHQISPSNRLTALLDIHSGLVRIYSEMVVMALLWHNVVLLRAYHAVLSLVITNVQRAVTPTIICIIGYITKTVHTGYQWLISLGICLARGHSSVARRHLGKFQPVSKH